jgi:hypothetical protein
MGLLVDVVLGTVVIAVPQARLPLLAVGVGTQVFKALGVLIPAERHIWLIPVLLVCLGNVQQHIHVS